MFAHVVVSRIADIVVQSVVVTHPQETVITCTVQRFTPVPLDTRLVARAVEKAG